jgi:Zn-finger nucleic acid-binding protein
LSTNYRETALLCPGCREVLEPKQVGEAVIDVCPTCGGIWVDWFDGDLVAMVQGAPRAGGARGGEAGGGGNGGETSCPRCRQELHPEQYLESRAAILRCGDCAGAFVARSAARMLIAIQPGRDKDPEKPDALTRLIAVLRRWFG